jgi:hypothetical protein
MSGAGAILRWHLSPMPCLPPRSPRSRAAGAGPGVRAALTSPQPPPLPRCGRGGGMSGAGAILRWHLSPMPCLPPRVCYALLALSAVRLEYDTQSLPK